MTKQKKALAAMLMAVIFSAMLLAGCGTTPTAANATEAPAATQAQVDSATEAPAPTDAPAPAAEATDAPADDKSGADATGTDATGTDATGTDANAEGSNGTDATGANAAGATKLVAGMTIELPGTVTPISVSDQMAVVSAQDGANTIAVTAIKGDQLKDMSADDVKSAVEAQLAQFNLEGSQSAAGKRSINGSDWDVNITTGKVQGMEMYVEAGVKDGYMVLVACTGANASELKAAADVLNSVKY